MEVEPNSSLEERLAQAMIDLRKGRSSNTNNLTSIHQRRDYLVSSIRDARKQIDLLKKENDLLDGIREKTETIRYQINPIRQIDAQVMPDVRGRCHDTREKSIQTEPVSNILHKAEKFKLINNLTNRKKMLEDKLKSLQLETNQQGPPYLLLKIKEYDDVLALVAKSTSNVNSSHVMEIENDRNVPPPNVQSSYSSWPVSATTTATTTTSSKIASNNNSNNTTSNNNGVIRPHEESDDEGVQLLLSMKRNVFNCKCGQSINSISYWSEHQRICSKSTEKNSSTAIGEQCQLCKKTFLTCVALNIHSTKKHNKKKVRTDSVMHCPCGQSFTAKWRQNCVHKLNNHGRHCKAFKERETQCSICKKGFIDRKSLEYHGLKAHKLAVPVSS